MTIDELFSRAVRDEATGCLLWQGALHRGYGRIEIRRGGRTIRLRAHRLIFELINGPLSPDRFVCHRCDVRRCIEPAHLFDGSAWDNIADMIAKKRHTHGESHGCARLTESLVARARDMFTAGRTTRDIAAELGSSQPATWKAIRGKSWAHVPGAPQGALGATHE